MINDEFSGQGGTYLLDPETGKRTLVKRTAPAGTLPASPSAPEPTAPAASAPADEPAN